VARAAEQTIKETKKNICLWLKKIMKNESTKSKELEIGTSMTYLQNFSIYVLIYINLTLSFS